jgi:hypothetical protein
MAKDLGKEKKPQRREIDLEYPEWPWVDYKLQDAKFFVEVNKLSVERLDRKSDLINAPVTIVDIAQIFGNVQKFKTTNPLLLEEHIKELEKLYWKIYGTGHITNNELYLWLVKGWVVKTIKRLKINWA